MHSSYSWNNKCQKCVGVGLNVLKIKKVLKRKKKSWELIRIYLPNSIANPAQFGLKWAGLALLFSKQILYNAQDFLFNLITLIFIYFFDIKPLRPMPVHFWHILFLLLALFMLILDLYLQILVKVSFYHYFVKIILGFVTNF